jgi:electron transport complex protein RnfG
MNKSAVAGGKIAAVYILAFIVVALAHLITASAIQRRGEQETYRALKDIAPNKSFGGFKNAPGAGPVLGYYPVWGGMGEPETYIVLVEGAGYGGPLSLMVHCKAGGEILAARLAHTQEYPGMGKEAETPAYMRKFTGTGAEKPVPLERAELSQTDAAAVSGASVTFRGVARALERASSFIKNGGTRK